MAKKYFFNFMLVTGPMTDLPVHIYILLKYHLWIFLPPQCIALDKFRMVYFDKS